MWGFNGEVDDPGTTHVECRKDPPVCGNGGYASWPMVHHDNWCGYFEPRFQVIDEEDN
jgi:hypothetical protein